MSMMFMFTLLLRIFTIAIVGGKVWRRHLLAAAVCVVVDSPWRYVCRVLGVRLRLRVRVREN